MTEKLEQALKCWDGTGRCGHGQMDADLCAKSASVIAVACTKMLRVAKAADKWERLRSSGIVFEKQFRDQVFALGAAVVELRVSMPMPPEKNPCGTCDGSGEIDVPACGGIEAPGDCCNESKSCPDCDPTKGTL